MIKKVWAFLFPMRRKRINYVFVTYSIGDELIKKGWTIAKEEDNNHTFGMVCLELLEPPALNRVRTYSNYHTVIYKDTLWRLERVTFEK